MKVPCIYIYTHAPRLGPSSMREVGERRPVRRKWFHSGRSKRLTMWLWNRDKRIQGRGWISAVGRCFWYLVQVRELKFFIVIFVCWKNWYDQLSSFLNNLGYYHRTREEISNDVNTITLFIPIWSQVRNKFKTPNPIIINSIEISPTYKI